MAFYFNENTPKKILYNGLNVAKLVYNGVVVWMSKVLATISGILPLTLTNSTGDDLVDYKIYGNTEEVLPRGYTRVEYLESSGTQYIDTGFKPTGDTKIKIKVQLPTQSTTQQGILGSRPGNAGRFTIFTGARVDALQADYNTESTLADYTTPISNFNATNVNEIEMSNKLVINETFVREVSKASFQSSVNLYLFANNNIGTPQLKMIGKIWYCKIWNGENLVRDLIPCINSSNVAGMYDTVTNTFYTNAGTGTFNVGSVVPKESVGDLVTDTSDTNYGKYKIPVLTNSHTTNIYLNKPLRKTSKLPSGYTELEHIRGTGTQYINIGCAMYNYSELELCFSFDEMQQDCSIFGSRQSSEKNNFEIASTNSFPLYLDFGNFSTSRATYNNVAINTKYICTISKSLRAIYDENNTLLARNTTIISGGNTTPSNARIFDTYNGFSANKLKGKIYYCKVWENGVLIRDMIPCKNSSNVVGMYDTVNDVFYTNAGSGSFIAGADVETVYYTDYLDYENQKVVRNVDDNYKGLDTPIEESVTLPTVPTDEGTVTVDVDTVIAPSNMEVVYYKNGS